MLYQKFRTFFQLVGVVAVGLLAVYGLVMAFSSSPAWAAMGHAAPLWSGADIPTTINYQGFLREPDGSLTTGSYNITARIYDQATGGTLLYTTVVPNVNVRDGLFNIVLGDDPPMPDSVLGDVPRYIGISLNGGTELIPRQRLHAVPWAMTAKTLVSNATINGLTSNSGINITSGDLTVAGNSTVSGDSDVDGNLAVTGNSTMNGDLSVNGGSTSVQNLNVNGEAAVTGDLNVTGDLTTTGKLTLPRKYQVFYAYDVDAGNTDRELGFWDICTLMSTEISQNGGYCSVLIHNNNDTWTSYGWGDMSAKTFPSTLDGDKPEWTLLVNSFSGTAKCEAICLNFDSN